MFDIIDDDEWFELALAVHATLGELPPGSRIVEALEIPAFRPAIRASGLALDSVETVPYASGQTSLEAAVRSAMSLSERHHTAGAAVPLDRAGELTVAVTQTDDGVTIAIAVRGLPGERCSFSTFDLRAGSHAIDVAYDVLAALNGWAYRRDGGETTRTPAHDAA